MLYVTAIATSTCSNGPFLTHAGPCAYDQYGRPIAGNINICENFFRKSHEWKKDVQLLLRQLTHITIMLSSLWNQFVNTTTGDLIPVEDVYDTTVDPPLLKSPILLQTVRVHFNCSTADGLPLQSSSSSQWHMRYLFSESMSAINGGIISQQYFFSKFTMALMVWFYIFIIISSFDKFQPLINDQISE